MPCVIRKVKKVIKQPTKRAVKKKPRKISMKKKTSKRYISKGYVPSTAKYVNFFDEKYKMMWNIVCKRKNRFED